MGVEEEEDFLFPQRLKSGTLPTCREARLANRVLTATWHKPPIHPTPPHADQRRWAGIRVGGGGKSGQHRRRIARPR